VAPLPALTGARFFAAISVVFYHYGLHPLGRVVPFLEAPAHIGPAAVSFFYVLSGAVITWGCTGADGLPVRPTRTFWLQRGARILPAYWLALALSVLPFAGHALQTHSHAGAALRVVLGVGSSLLLVQAFIPPLAGGLNTPGWSISCEAFFYTVWPRLVRALRSERTGFPLRATLVCGLVALIFPLFGLWCVHAQLLPRGPFPSLLEGVSGDEFLLRFLSYFPPFRLPEFVLGIALGHALRQTPAREHSVAADTLREAGLTAVLFAWACVVGSGLPLRITGDASAQRICIESGALAPLFALLVWQLARGRGLLQRLCSTRPLLALGEASYALYVLQEPVLVWVTAVLKRVSPALAAHDNAVFWAYALLLVLLSLAAHRFVEMPLRSRLLARFARPAPAQI